MYLSKAGSKVVLHQPYCIMCCWVLLFFFFFFRTMIFKIFQHLLRCQKGGTCFSSSHSQLKILWFYLQKKSYVSNTAWTMCYSPFLMLEKAIYLFILWSSWSSLLSLLWKATRKIFQFSNISTLCLFIWGEILCWENAQCLTCQLENLLAVGKWWEECYSAGLTPCWVFV